MITQLVIALILIAIICVIAGAILKLLAVMGVAIPAPVSIVAWAIVAVLCLLLLYQVVTGQGINLNL